MPKSYELDSLKSAEQDAFERKQRAWKVYADLRERCSTAHDTMEFAWHDRVVAREEMNSEYESMQQAREQSAQIWDEYGRIRDSNNYEIERLRAEANSEHQQMIECFDRASECYQFGDKSEAPYWSQQGHDHKERRDELNEEVRRLCEEVKAAKQDAMWRAPKVDASAFHRAKAIFESAKARHETAQSEFKRLKTERDRAKAEFESAQEEFKRAKEAFQRKLEEVKANNQRERDRVLDKAGVRYSERKDAKIVKKSDGTTQVYHGGIGSGDGYGHGHTALDQFGRKTYDRGAFEDHGRQNFTDDGKGVTIYDRNARPGHEVMGIEGRSNLHGQSYKQNKHPEEVGHITQFYDDGVRVSRSTTDNIHETRVHWTNERLPVGHPNYHEKPED